MMKSVVFSVLALCLVKFVLCQEDEEKMCERMKKWVKEEICEKDNRDARSCMEKNFPQRLATAMADISGTQDISMNIDSICKGTLNLEDISDEEKKKVKECLNAE